jgi:lipopolysaccharide export system permease protein
MLRARTLRYYIGRRFLAMMVGALTVCMTLIFMIDMVELLRQSRSATSVTVWQLMWVGFLRMHAFTEILIPFAVLVGSIGALMSLSRRSELAVMRAGGMSVWQFLRPGMVVALGVGIFSVVVYNPLAAEATGQAELLMAKYFGNETSFITGSAGNWLRQDGADGPSVMRARAAAEQGLSLTGVTVFKYDPAGRFVAHINAEKASLGDGYWDLSNATVAQPGREIVRYGAYKLATHLDRERALDAFGAVNSVSVFELPAVIDMVERSKLPSAKFRVQFELLRSRPFLLVTMVLLAATVSLRSFRQGGIQTMVVTGIIGGLGFFLLTEVSRQIGLSGLAPAVVAIWLPVLIAGLASLTVLLHQEDG